MLIKNLIKNYRIVLLLRKLVKCNENTLKSEEVDSMVIKLIVKLSLSEVDSCYELREIQKSIKSLEDNYILSDTERICIVNFHNYKIKTNLYNILNNDIKRVPNWLV